MKVQREFVFATIFFLAYLFIGLLTISHYNINWDEPAHFLRGQAYLRFFLTGKKDYADLPKIRTHYPNSEYGTLPNNIQYDDDSDFRRSLYQYDREEDKFTFRYYLTQDKGHPPLNGILASLSNYIFYQKLSVASDIDSYHIFVIFVSSLLVLGVFFFVAANYGTFPAIVASLSLALYPLFFAESHFNLKDPVESAFFAFTLFTFYLGITKRSWRFLLVSSLCAGLALGTKFNILFAAFIAIPWLVIYKWKHIRTREWPFSKAITIVLFLLPIIALAILFLSWPFLWRDPIVNFQKILSYYQTIGGTGYQTNDYFILAIFNTYAAQWVLFTTPLIILFLSAIGIFYTIRFGFKEKNMTAFFVLLWLFVTIVRVSFSTSGIYGGVRQIMEYIPAMAILAGIGTNYMVKWLHSYMIKRMKLFNHVTIQTMQLLTIVLFLPITLKLISIHPNENVYFNPLIGGLKGAKEKNLADWGMTLGSSYKQGTDWLNAHAEEGADVTLVRGLLSNVPLTQFRRDIHFDNRYYSGEQKKGEYILELTDYQWNREVPVEMQVHLSTLLPVYEVKVDGVVIVTIWKNSKEFLKK